MESWYTCVTCTNFVPQISTMLLILCTKVQFLNFCVKNATVGPFLRSRDEGTGAHAHVDAVLATNEEIERHIDAVAAVLQMVRL
jgi:hypothetical protein